LTLATLSLRDPEASDCGAYLFYEAGRFCHSRKASRVEGKPATEEEYSFAGGVYQFAARHRERFYALVQSGGAVDLVMARR